jgi:L-aminopeptidase/D-esterase-like protein
MDSATPTVDLDPGSLTDVAGLAVGHAAESGRPTGCTVVLCPQGVVCGVAVRGGSPGTRETDLLRPENTVSQVHAVLLTGGSAFGLDAAGGVMRWLDERGHGLVVGPARVPIVPAAVLFDLWLGDPRIRPHAGTGYAACEAARTDAPAQGNAGAGLGATVGKSFGLSRAMKGGVGTASVKRGDLTVAALVAVNAVGDVLATDGSVIAGARTADGMALAGSLDALLQDCGPDRVMQGMTAGMATTIGVVATNARLDKAQATQLAGLAHHGLSRAVSPISVTDGDTLFALATGTAGLAGDAGALGAMAAEAVARAIRNAVRAAQGLADPAVPAARDLKRG